MDKHTTTESRREFIEQHRHYSERAGEIIRNLGFAGIAAIWVFKMDSQGKTGFPYSLGLAGLFFILGLAADLLQYIVGTFIWSWLAGRNVNAEHALTTVDKVDGFLFVFMLWKAVAMIAGYCILLRYLGGHLYNFGRG